MKEDETSVLNALTTYAKVGEQPLSDIYDSSISINQAGEKFEYFIKDLLCDSFDEESKSAKDAQHKSYLSWLGSQHNPPDLMIRDSAAIEVKKSRGKHQKVALNSSPPKQKLTSQTKRITNDCQSCEDDIGGWSEKDMVYALGSDVSNSSVGFTWIVYGDCWCESNDTYIDTAEELTENIKSSTNGNDMTVDTSGNELAKVRDVDTHGRTSKRIRGMWNMEHPATYFSQFVDNYEQKIDNGSPIFLVIRKDTFYSCDDIGKLRYYDDITWQEISVVDPDNLDSTIDCVLVECSS